MKYAHKLSKWIRSHKREFILLLVILTVNSVLRFYKIDQYMTFLGDEGRDVILVRRLLVDFDPILIGPGTSIGNMYLGPLYYYMMAPALLFANFSPIGPAVMIAILSVVTIVMVYYLSRVWFPSKEDSHVNYTALLVAWLYGISPTIIIYSRSSWNPNIMPFFALISIYSIWKVWIERSYKWMIVLAIGLTGVIQSHYLGLILFAVVGIFWVMSLINEFLDKKKGNLRKFLSFSFLSAFIFLLTISPLFIFDIRHGYINLNSMKKFFGERQTTVSAKPWSSIPKLGEVSSEINASLLGGRNMSYANILIVIFAAVALWYFAHLIKLIVKNRKGKGAKKLVASVWKSLNDKKLSPYLMLIVWLGMALMGLGVYKQEIYDHYYGFIFATPFLLLSALIAIFYSQKRTIGIIFSILVLFVSTYISFSSLPLKYPPNNQYSRSVEVSERMVEEADGERFNIAVIAERNYEGAYQYHLERINADFVIIDPERADDTITTQLFVVCELPADECDPVHNDKAEVANFGWSKVADEWEVAGTTLYRLIKNEEGTPQ